MLTYRRASVASLLFPVFGVPAVLASVRAGRLARQGEVESARVEGEKARDHAWNALGYGLVVYFALFVAYLLTVNDGAIRQTYLAADTFTDGNVVRSLLKGFWINLQVFLWAQAIVLVWSLAVALVRLLPGRACAPIRFVAAVYVDGFRAVPAIIVIYIIGLGLPRADLPLIDDFSDKQFAILALVLVYGAYVSEVYRAGIESIHWSQVAAARSLGLTYAQTMRHVVVPQAVRRIRPPLVNDAVALQKDTSLIGFIGPLDAVSRARFASNSQANLTGYTMAAILFAAISIPLTRYLERLTRRDHARMDVG